MMRWAVLLLIVANALVFLWFWVNDLSGVQLVEEGRLPRVAEIELIDEQGEVADAPSSPAERKRQPGGQGQLAQPSKSPEPDLQVGAELDQTPAKSSVQPKSCFGIGWFQDLDSAEAFRIDQLPFGSRLGIKERSETLEPFHWVIIPPRPSRQEAVEKYRELVERDIEAYVVPSGESENAISLGLFRSLASAERVLAQRQAQNIEAALVKFPRNRISYALVFEGAAPESLGEFVGTSDQSEVILQLIEISDCEGVATAKKNP